MTASRRSPSALLNRRLALGVSFLAGLASAQEPARPSDTAREQMWPAPSAEDWKKPVLITFQRTWEDAVTVSKQTGRPILVCVNMDGEPASEHYAGIRYRQADIAELYAPYVCVIASVYRHTPRDHDEHGDRILCPRFGSVTCGEHIAIEPVLYERFMDGRRIAPRHIMVELDGSETYDVYYALDTQSVFDAIGGGIANRAFTPPPVVRGDRSIVERVASRDVEDRKAVESAYRDGDAELRRALLEAARMHPDSAPTDLLRLAVFGFDPELGKVARQALAQLDAEGAAELIADALRVPMEPAERDALVAALQRIGENSPRARTLAVVHRGLGSRSTSVDVEGWSSAIQGGSAYAPPPDWSTLSRNLDAEVAGARPDDAAARLGIAEASLALAVDPATTRILSTDRKTGSKYARLMLEDSRRAALDAEKLGATGWRVNAVVALASYYLGDKEAAYARAEAAAKDLPTGAQEWIAISTLALFAEARHTAIVEAARQKQDWPGQWLTDASAAYSVLARHPLGTDVQVASHYDLLVNLGARGRAVRVLEEGLARFPESSTLHDCLRSRILREQGVSGLLTTYDELLAKPDAPPTLPWFAGYAAIVAAEFDRRTGDADAARAAYDRAIALFERAIESGPETRPSSDHYVAIALAGRARLALEAGDAERALGELLASFERKPDAAASLDGLNISPVDTARMLRARLTTAERADLLARLDAALARLDPELLRLPAYEREGPGPGNRGPGRRRGR